MTDVRVVEPSGATTILTHLDSEVERDQNKLPTSRIRVPRSEVNGADLEQADDEMYIREGGTDEFGGILKDVVRASGARQGSTELVVEPFERLAEDAEPAPPKQSYTDVGDATIVRDAIDGVPDLGKGRIQSQQSGIDILFHHATRALQIRMMRAFSGGEIRYNADKTVDYVSSLGTDRSGTTISPTNQNIAGLRKLEQSGGPHKTHLRVIGAGGTSVDVVADSFSGGEREKWGRAHFKSVANKDALRQLGSKLLEDLATKWTEVSAELVELSPAPAIGDTYTVDYPKEDINSTELRVANLRTIRDDDGKRWKARLSNRSFARSQQVDSPAQQAEEMSRAGQTTSTQNIPAVNFPMVQLPGGEFIDQLFFLLPEHELYLWMVSATPTQDDAIENVNICVKLVERPGLSSEKEIYTQCLSSYKSGNPLFKVEASDAGRKMALRLENTATTTVACSATVAYTTGEVA